MPPKLPSPYKVIFSEGFHQFTTDAGIPYRCAFTPVELDYDLEVNAFQFYPQGKPEPDPRIPPTVAQLLKDNLTDPYKVVMYICDPVDGKWQARQRLFKQWHENMGTGFDRHDLVIRVGESEANGGVIVRNTFPYNKYPGIVNKGIVVAKF